MKIGYYNTHFPYKDLPKDDNYLRRYEHIGGTIAPSNLAISMAKRGHKVSVFTTSIDSADAVEKRDNLTVYRYGTKIRLLSSNIALGMFSKPLREELDIIHSHFTTPPSNLAALRHAKKKNIPLVLTYHGDWEDSYGPFARRAFISFYNRFLLDRELSYARVITVPSEYYVNSSKFLGRFRDKIIPVPNGINPDALELPYSKPECRQKLGLPLEARVILFVGPLSPPKGIDVLLGAMPKVMEAITDARLILVGDGVLRGKLKELAHQLELDNCVTFVGFVGDDSTKALYYNLADIFVLPSNREVYPLVLLEAFAVGLPAVTSDLETFNCIIDDGYNGIMTKQGNTEELANAIVRLLKDNKLRADMGARAKKRTEDFLWDKIAEDMEKVYTKVLEGA